MSAAFERIGLSAKQIRSVLELMSAILHLCQVDFEQPVAEDDVTRSFGLDVIGQDHLQAAAELLRCDIDHLSNSMMYR